MKNVRNVRYGKSGKNKLVSKQIRPYVPYIFWAQKCKVLDLRQKGIELYDKDQVYLLNLVLFVQLDALPAQIPYLTFLGTKNVRYVRGNFFENKLVFASFLVPYIPYIFHGGDTQNTREFSTCDCSDML